MKINVISDIHATYNFKTNEVMYSMPKSMSKNKCLKTIADCIKTWEKSKDLLEKLTFKPVGLDRLIADELSIKSYDDCITLFKDFSKAVEADFSGMTVDDMFKFSRNLMCINSILTYTKNYQQTAKARLSKKAIDYMFKHFGDFDPTKLEPADYLIVAGDLGLDNIYDKVLADLEKKTAGKFKKILHIAGNHDHWWIGDSRQQLAKPDAPNYAHDYCIHEDGEYLFLGCTLWTPISDNAAWSVGRHMNDYRYTPGNFTPYTSRTQYAIQSEWLRNKIDANTDKKIIVFTHHQPFEELTLDDYKHNGHGWDGADVNAAYVVLDHSLDDINHNKNIKLWCCGHTHQCFDGMLHDVHVIRNPIGYGDLYDYIPAENIRGNWYNKVIEV